MRRLLKILAWAAGITLVLMILAVVGLKILLPDEKIRTMAVERGSEMLGRDVIIEGIDISVWGGLGVRLEGVFVANPEGMDQGNFLAAKDVDVKLQLLPLISGEFAIDRLIVNHPRITMRKAESGSSNYSFETVDQQLPAGMDEDVPDEAKTALAAVTFDKLEIRDGLVDFQDDSSDVAILLHGFFLSSTLTSPRDNALKSTGEIRADSIQVTLDEPWPTYRIGIEYSGEYDLTRKRVDVRETHLYVNGLKFLLEGSLDHAGAGMQSRGNIKSRSIAVADLFKLMPSSQADLIADYDIDGSFELDLDVDHDTERGDTHYSGTAKIQDLSMSRADIPGKLQFKRALADFEPDNLRFNIEDGTFDNKPIKGHVLVTDFDNPVLTGELAGSLNLAFAEPFIPAEQETSLSGEMQFSTKFSGATNAPTEMEFSGEVAISNGRYASSLISEPIESFDLDAYLDNRLMRINSFKAKMPSGEVTYTGRINNLIPYLLADSSSANEVVPSMDGRLAGEIELGMLTQFLPKENSPEMGGHAEFDIKLAGDASRSSNFKPQGTFEVTNAFYRDTILPEPIEKFEIRGSIEPDTISVDNLEVAFPSSDLTFRGKLIDPFPYLLPLDVVDKDKVDKPVFVFDLKSKRFDFDRLFPEAVPGSGVNRGAQPTDSVPPVILPDIDGRGQFSIDSLIYSEVEFTQVRGRVRVIDKKIECWDVSGKAYSGDIKGTTTIDLADFENPHYTGDFQARQIEADDFISRFTDFGGYLTGKFDFNGNYSADGWEPEQFLRALNLDGNLSMRQGKFTTNEKVHSAVSNLADKIGQTVNREQALKDLKSAVKVEDGKVKVDAFTTSLGSLGDVTLDGFYGFDGALNYSGSIFLSETTTRKLIENNGLTSALGGLLGNKGPKRIKLPIGVSGTIDDPKVKVDLADALRESGKKGLEDAFKGLFKK